MSLHVMLKFKTVDEPHQGPQFYFIVCSETLPLLLASNVWIGVVGRRGLAFGLFGFGRLLCRLYFTGINYFCSNVRTSIEMVL